MTHIFSVFIIIVCSIMLTNIMFGHDGGNLPPYLKSETPGKVCVAIFDKSNELVGIDCDVPVPKDNGKKEPIRKGE